MDNYLSEDENMLESSKLILENLKSFLKFELDQ